MSWRIIEHEGREHRVAVVRSAEGVWVGWPGGATLVRHERGAAGGRAEPDEVRAPMTGTIVSVRVQVGDQLTEGDVVAVLEAMKMEYRLSAPHEGRVEAVHCSEGELVDLGKTLVTISKPEQ